MKQMDTDGLLLCDLQASTFELSIDAFNTGSEVFIRRFMNSEISKRFDDCSLLLSNYQARDIIDDIEGQYGYSEYGSKQYSKAEIHWIGYLYRFFSYTYELSSKQVYKIVKPKELRALYLAYHTLDPAQAIERILESKNILGNEEAEIQRQYNIFKSVKMLHARN